ncbi:MAG: hypothetical protein CL718_00625 [Chloroflexi bacterium]|nr:hypothetical protein [Chloroflexota bacterium]|tara:strand:- start:178 stop:690 length:513 start_codon:yes stop_codon:yes gene_type:complete
MEVKMFLKIKVSLLSFLTLLLIGCSSSSDDASVSSSTSSATSAPVSTEAVLEPCTETLNVELANDGPYAITTPDSFQGNCEINFTVKNYAALVHNFQVLQTDLAVDALPLNEETAMVDVEAAGELLYSSKDLEQDETETGTLKLEAGEYILFCNIAGHYQLGMIKTFTIN